MINKALLYGVIGFVLGGLVVSTAAVTFDKDESKDNSSQVSTTSTADHNKTATDKLKGLEGNDFDKAFLAEMIDHHQSAIDTAKLTATNAKHEEVKNLGNDILSTQSREIDMMRAWQDEWGYNSALKSHDRHGM